jgi:hypothetical protein
MLKKILLLSFALLISLCESVSHASDATSSSSSLTKTLFLPLLHSTKKAQASFCYAPTCGNNKPRQRCVCKKEHKMKWFRLDETNKLEPITEARKEQLISILKQSQRKDCKELAPEKYEEPVRQNSSENCNSHEPSSVKLKYCFQVRNRDDGYGACSIS